MRCRIGIASSRAWSSSVLARVTCWPLASGLPGEGADLLEAQADEGVAVPQGVVEEGEWAVAGQGEEPEAELGELDGRLVLVDAVEAALGDEAPGVEDGVLVGGVAGDVLEAAFAGPRGDELVAEVAARGDEEGAGAHGGVADLELEELIRGGGVAHGGEEGLEGALDDGGAEAARGVVAAGAAALGAGLEDELAGAGEDLAAVPPAAGRAVVGEGVLVGGGARGVVEVLVHGDLVEARLELLRLGGGEADLLLEPLGALRRPGGEDLVDGEPLAALHAHGRRLHALDVVAHQRLVDGADLLDVERLVGEARALEDDEALEDAVDGAVVDGGDGDLGLELGGAQRRGARGDALEEGVAVRVEEVPVARRHVERAVVHAEEDGAKDDEELAPGAVALGHGVGGARRPPPGGARRGRRR